MKYQVGDLFVDIRGKENRTFLITEVIVDGLILHGYIYYRLYVSPDDKEDVWGEGMIKLYLDKTAFLYYPVVK